MDCWGLCPVGFWIYPRMETPRSLRKLFHKPVLQWEEKKTTYHPPEKKPTHLSPMFKWNFLYFFPVSIASCLAPVTFSSLKSFAGLDPVFWCLTCTGEPSIGPSTLGKYRESITSLYLWAVLCLMQLLMLLTFLFSTKAHCCLMESLVSIRPSYFLPHWLPGDQSPASSDELD